MVTRALFTVLVVGVAVQRLAELRVSRRNEVELRRRGAREHAAWQVPMLAAVHTAWLVSACVEVWWLEPPFRLGLALTALVVLAAGQVLRRAAMTSLGPRWTVAIFTLPSAAPVTSGIYRYLRHPNYAGVALEIAALPLVHGAIWTAGVFSGLNALALAARIRAEERALDDDNAYASHFNATHRFLPTAPRPPAAP